MKKILIGMIFSVATCLFAVSGLEVMKMVDERDDGKTMVSESKMVLTNRQGKQRIRKTKMFKKEYGQGDKSLFVFLEPADVEGTAFLNWSYDELNKDDEKWLYMPALHRVRRIASSNTGDYFMGTDFTYDDMGQREPEEDTHMLLADESFENVDCWVVESKPKEDDYQYSKVIRWISKEYLLPMKAEFYDKRGRYLKKMTVSNIQKVDGIWTAFSRLMENEQEQHTTLLEIQSVKYNQEISDRLFKVANLNRGKF